MSDKEAFSNHAKILENTPARTVVQWRYPLVDVYHTIANYDTNTGWGDWSDWTYTIYPDGVAAKTMRLWSSGPICCEFSWAADGQSVLAANPSFTTSPPGLWRYDAETGSESLPITQ